MSERKNKKILYLHGRPSPHPLHAILASSVGSTYYPVDTILRWQDKDKSILFRIFSSFINAILYPFRKFNIILVDNLHIAPIIAKKIRPFNKNKIAVHLGSHTLFFLYNNQYSSFVKKIHLWALKNYDVVICEGEMAKELVFKILPDFKNDVYVSFLGPKKDRNEKLKEINPNLDSNKVLIIANGPGEYRKYYKGLDIMINSFLIAADQNTDITLEIVGLWDQKIIDSCLENVPLDKCSRILFSGATNNIEDKLRDTSLYFHCSRGDAFPTSTIESMASGVPTLVSNWTGTKQLAKCVDDNFIVNLNEEDISKKIIWYFSLTANEKKQFSDNFKKIALNYTEELAVKRYMEIFDNI